MTWVDKIATAEKGNVPYGAIFLASLAQAVGVLGAGLLVSKYPQTNKYANPLIGAGGAVLVPQLKKYIGEPSSKALGIGFGCQVVAPYIGQGLNKVVGVFTPATPAAAGRRSAPYRAPAGVAAEGDLAASATAGAETR